MACTGEYVLTGWTETNFMDALKNKLLTDKNDLTAALSSFANVVVLNENGKYSRWVYDAAQSGTNDGINIINGWIREKSEQVTPLYFGAKGDGATDDRAAVQAALATGENVNLKGKTYKVNVNDAAHALKIKKNQKIFNGKLDFSGSTIDDANIPYFTNENFGEGTATTTTAAIAKGDIQFDLASVAGIERGSIIRLESSEDFSDTSKKGEVVEVDEVAGSTVKLFDTTTWSYPSGVTATVYDNDHDIALEHVRIKGNGTTNSPLLKFVGVNGVDIKSCSLSDGGYALSFIKDSINVSVTSTKFRKATKTGYAYGVMLYNTKNVNISAGCTFAHMRHGVTVTGNGAQSDKITVLGNHFNMMIDAGIDAHKDCINMTIKGNTISGDYGKLGYTSNNDGITYQGMNCLIEGNNIDNVSGSGIFIQPLHYQDTRIKVNSNEITNHGTTGIYMILDNKAATSNKTKFTVNGNTVDRSKEAGGHGIYILLKSAGGAGMITKSSTVSGNAITLKNAHGIYLRGDDNGNIKDVSVNGNSMDVEKTASTTYGVYIYKGDDNLLVGNRIKGTGADYGIRAAGGGANNKEYNNMITGFSTATAGV